MLLTLKEEALVVTMKTAFLTFGYDVEFPDGVNKQYAVNIIPRTFLNR